LAETSSTSSWARFLPASLDLREPFIPNELEKRADKTRSEVIDLICDCCLFVG